MKPTILITMLMLWLLPQTKAQSFNYLTAMSKGNFSENHMVVDRHGNAYLTFTYTDLLVVDGLDFYNSTGWTSILLKFNTDGNLIWGYSFVNTGSTTIHSIALDKGDGVVVSGSFHDTLYVDGETFISTGGDDALVVGFSPEGNIRYANSFGSVLSDEATNVCVDKTGNKFVLTTLHEALTFAGETVTPIDGAYPTVICKFNKNGTPADLIVINNDSYLVYQQMVIDNKNNLIITGVYYENFDILGEVLNNPGNMFVAKLDMDMNLVWANEILIDGSTYLKDMAVDKAGNPYMLFTIDTITIDGNTYYDASGEEYGTESLLCKLNKSTGVAKWANKFNSYSSVYATGIAINDLQNIAVTGFYQDYINYGTMEITSPGPDLWDGFVMIADPDGNVMNLFDLGDNTTYDELWNVEFNNTSDLILYGYSGNGLELGDYMVEAPFGGGFWLTSVEFGTYKTALPYENNDFTISPNPAVETVQVHFNNAEAIDSELQIFDVTGRLVYTTVVSPDVQQQITIDISHFSAGAYIVKYQQQQQQLIVTK